MKENNKETKIEELLNSLEGMQRASPGPYFFTRLQQRLNVTKPGILERLGTWISRPAIAFGSLLVVILLNLAVLSGQTSKNEKSDEVTEEYTIASAIIIDYENTVSE